MIPTQICLGTYMDAYIHVHIQTYGQPTTIHMYTPAQTYIERSLYTCINNVTVGNSQQYDHNR